MSHAVDTMAFVGKVPWWGLGVDLQPGDTIQDRCPDMATNVNGAAVGTFLGDASTLVTGSEMLKAAGLDWRVFLKPAIALVGNEAISIPDTFAVIREDIRTALGTVGKKYTIVQNAELFAVPDVLVSEGHVSYETAGSLNGGKQVWALLRWASKVINRLDGTEDPLERYLLWLASHDGNSSVLGGFTDIRVVCKNTCDAATGTDGKALKNRVAIRHTKSASERLAEAHRSFMSLHEEAERFEAMLQDLANTPMTAEQMQAFSVDFLNEVQHELDEEHERYHLHKAEREKAIDEMVTLFSNGKGNMGADQYDGFNAVTEWLDHKRGRYEASRTFAQQQQHMHSTMVGQRYKRKGKALQMLKRIS